MSCDILIIPILQLPCNQRMRMKKEGGELNLNNIKFVLIDIIELTPKDWMRIILLLYTKKVDGRRMDNMERNNQMTARVFKAMGDENRLTILSQLKDGERCACKLQEVLGISQPTLSHHMRILLDAGLVSGRKEGKWIHYSLSESGAQQAKALLCSVLNIQ